MTFSIYAASVPVLSASLKSLSHILRKGEAFAASQGLDPDTLLAARLAPDMHPLTGQVQLATDHAKGISARLAARDVPSFVDDEKTFADLHARIEKTRDFLKSLPADAFEGAEDREITMKLRQPMTFTGQSYLLGFGLPNFYFHVTTAYAILRNKGVPLGKGDFFGAS